MIVANKKAAAVCPDGKLNLSGGLTKFSLLKLSNGLSLHTVFLINKYMGN